MTVRRLASTCWRLVDRCLTAIAVLVCLAVLAVVVGGVVGYRLLVVETGSMVPALHVGDLVVSHDVRPMAVHPGQVVTFRDAALGGRLVTHRVVRMQPDGLVVHFTTKGDANRTMEHWSVPKTGTIGHEVADVRGMGYLLADLTTSTAKLAVIWFVALYLAVLGARWVWHRPGGLDGHDLAPPPGRPAAAPAAAGGGTAPDLPPLLQILALGPTRPARPAVRAPAVLEQREPEAVGGRAPGALVPARAGSDSGFDPSLPDVLAALGLTPEVPPDCPTLPGQATLVVRTSVVESALAGAFRSAE